MLVKSTLTILCLKTTEGTEVDTWWQKKFHTLTTLLAKNLWRVLLLRGDLKRV